MNKPVLRGVVLVGAVGLGLWGCGGGGGGSSSSGSTPPATVSAKKGKVTDGYVSGASVILDQNGNGVCESSEPTTTTDAEGNYEFAGSLGEHLVCASGGVDIATGQPFVGELKAPAGATQVTPLTSLVVAMVGGNASPSAIAAAVNDLAADLGLTGTDLLKADPVALKDTKPELLEVTAAIQVLMVQTASVLQAAAGEGAAAAGSANTNALYGVAIKSVVAALDASGGIAVSGNLGDIAEDVVKKAAVAAKADAAIAAALPNLASIEPTSVAAFAGPALAAMTNAVADAGADALLAPTASNPATLAAANVSVANTVAAIADVLLTTTAATTVTPAQLADIAEAALPVSTGSASPQAVDAATIVAAITTSVPTITVPPEVQAALATANAIKDYTAVSGVVFNCSATGASCFTVSSPTVNADNKAVIDHGGALSNVWVKLAAANGLAVKGTAKDDGVVSSGTPLSGSVREGSLAISIVPVSAASSQQKILLEIDKIYFYQVGTTSSSYVKAQIPSSAKLKVTATTASGVVAKAELNGSAAAGFLSLDGAPAEGSYVKVDIAGLVSSLGPQASANANAFSLLQGLVNGGLSGSGKSYLISVSSASIAFKLPSDEIKTSAFSVQVNFPTL